MPSPKKNETLEQREKRLIIQRAYEARCREKDPEGYRKRCNEAAKRWRDANPDKRKIATKKWRTENRDKWNESRRKWRENNIIHALFMEAKHRAKSRGIEFSIILEDVPPMGELCPLLGLPFSTRSEKKTATSPSLDRIDSSRGYVKGNVWIVGYRANIIKNDGTAEEHYRIAESMRQKGVI